MFFPFLCRFDAFVPCIGKVIEDVGASHGRAQLCNDIFSGLYCFRFPVSFLSCGVVNPCPDLSQRGKAEERSLDRGRVNEVIEDVMEITRALYEKGNDTSSCDER